MGYRNWNKNLIAALIVFAIGLILTTAAAQKTNGSHHHFRWEHVTVKSGDTLSSIFKRLKISNKTLMSILQLAHVSGHLKHLRIGQHMRFLLNERNELQTFVFPLNQHQSLVIFKAGSRYVSRIENVGDFIPKSPAQEDTHSGPQPPPQKPSQSPTASSQSAQAIQQPVAISGASGLHYTGIIIHSSLYADARKAGIPTKLLLQLIQIFSTEIDFSKNIHQGDKIVFAYEDSHSGELNIAAAKFTDGRKVYAAIRYPNAQKQPEYFTPDGGSLKKAFNRYPVKFTHISSLFSMHRRHPVYHTVRPHTGIDLAAPLGSPIHTVGDGRVVFIGREGAYGNLIKIKHNERYTTFYAHLLRFAPGLTVGSYVKQGQLIGYLGQTGNATGPHVHFEVRISNTPVNPATIKLPTANPVPASQLAAFKARAKTLMASLDYYERTSLK